MYGVTESEKFHILPPVALLHGVLDGQRDEILRDHAKVNLLAPRSHLIPACLRSCPNMPKGRVPFVPEFSAVGLVGFFRGLACRGSFRRSSRACPQATHELEPELILSKVLEQYGDFRSGFTKDYATMNRDMVLEAISDSGTVAPLITTANLHSRANPKSYMYVFSHPKAMQDYPGVSRSLSDTAKIDYRGSDAALKRDAPK